MVWCRWSDSNRHGFPPHFECGASAIPPHRHLRQRHCKYYTTNYARRQDKIEDFPFLYSIKFDRLSGFVALIIRALPVSKGEKSEDPPSVGKEDTFPLFHFESVSCAPDRFDVLGAAAVLLNFFPNSLMCTVTVEASPRESKPQIRSSSVSLEKTMLGFCARNSSSSNPRLVRGISCSRTKTRRAAGWIFSPL